MGAEEIRRYQLYLLHEKKLAIAVNRRVVGSSPT
jgi:hypothetical protein